LFGDIIIVTATSGLLKDRFRCLGCSIASFCSMIVTDEVDVVVHAVDKEDEAEAVGAASEDSCTREEEDVGLVLVVVVVVVDEGAVDRGLAEMGGSGATGGGRDGTVGGAVVMGGSGAIGGSGVTGGGVLLVVGVDDGTWLALLLEDDMIAATTTTQLEHQVSESNGERWWRERERESEEECKGKAIAVNQTNFT
jgi:hypothetical protein